MKVFLSVKYYPDNRNREHIESLLSVLEQIGFETTCVIRDVEQWGRVSLTSQLLMGRTFAELESCDTVLIDSTDKGVGLGIEAGYAYARHIPIITIARNGSDISETLRGISHTVFMYNEVNDLKPILWESLLPLARGDISSIGQ
jgi:nucleoside 2-deoxyribosyltransferase